MVIFANRVCEITFQTDARCLCIIVDKLISVIPADAVVGSYPNISFGVFVNVIDIVVWKSFLFCDEVEIVFAEERGEVLGRYIP